MDIMYIKLTNGEELFANLIGNEENTYFLDEVLILETVHADDSLKYQFMSRYTPYSKYQSMSIDKHNIICIQEASEPVKRHYKISLEYAKNVADPKFTNGISDASNFLKTLLLRDTKEENVMSAHMESDTKH